MPTIQLSQLSAEVSREDILKAIDQLDEQELDELVSGVLKLRARRRAPALSKAESDLLLKINEGIPKDLWDRYHTLILKRDDETLGPDEYAELLTLSDQVEEYNAQRIGYLVELARLRGVSLDKLMSDLGIHPINHG
ncbi:MAG: STAS/SEC14 domain-containing protein [Anaerolineae bacterium]|nr:STAS/SEC14 domain-containing protein [Anaerolineae bacterium]